MPLFLAQACTATLLAIEMMFCFFQPPVSSLVILADTFVVLFASVVFISEGGTALAAFAAEALLVVVLRVRGAISPPLRISPVDLTDKVAIVTGGYSGVGKETARLLAEWNATVILACRDKARAESVAGELQASLSSSSTGKVLGWELDLEAFSSVTAFAERFLASSLPLHILVNNAGVRYHDLEVTGDGIELHYQVNHLSHFLLTLRLLPRLRASAPARIVHVSSSAHAYGEVNLEVYGAGRPNTDPELFRRRMQAVEGVYGDTKLMQVLFSNRLDAVLSAEAANVTSRVTSVAVHPGFVATNFGHRDRRWLQTMLLVLRPFLARDHRQGALTQVYAATSPELQDRGGLYLDNCAVSSAIPLSHSAELQQGLWDASVQLTQLPEKLNVGQQTHKLS